MLDTLYVARFQKFILWGPCGDYITDLVSSGTIVKYQTSKEEMFMIKKRRVSTRMPTFVPTITHYDIGDYTTRNHQ